MDTNARLAATAQRVLKGEVSPGIAAGQALAAFSLSSSRRAQRKFNDAFAHFRSGIQDAAALADPETARVMLRFLSVLCEHVPAQRTFDEAMRVSSQK